jgi:hypothetical protein
MRRELLIKALCRGENDSTIHIVDGLCLFPDQAQRRHWNVNLTGLSGTPDLAGE